jgi:hypothetical protein
VWHAGAGTLRRGLFGGVENLSIRLLDPAGESAP